jgi:hypothetical protein
MSLYFSVLARESLAERRRIIKRGKKQRAGEKKEEPPKNSPTLLPMPRRGLVYNYIVRHL